MTLAAARRDSGIRILLLADSHLGFDLPTRPRVERRRRGHDFLANYARALAPALAGEVDVVVHAGDVFDRSSVISTLAYQAFEPLRRTADAGVPVLIVPGNHERSRLPHLRFASHPRIHVFATPSTFVVEVRGTRVAFAGFPYERAGVRSRFGEILAQTGSHATDAEHHVLCMHHCVEGATVGPANYTFTTAADVIRLRDIPARFSAALSGHIHRHQAITADLARRAIQTPVLYPGSIERTALAEIGEPKGFMIVHLDASGVRWEFRELPARPMLRHEIDVANMSDDQLAHAVDVVIAAAPPDAVLSLRVTGALTDAHWRVLSTARLRAVAPASMNVDIAPDRIFDRTRRQSRESVDDPTLRLNL
jgi:exonuclease SbcD